MTGKSMTCPFYRGKRVDEMPGGFGPLKSSIALAQDREALRERMREEGYLYLPGLLDPERVWRARRSIVEKLAAEQLLDPDKSMDEAVARPDVQLQFRPDLANGNPAITALLHEAEMMAFWELFLGGPVRPFDFLWLRAKGPGADTVTPPHCDSAFMNRGTPNLYTAWTPLGEVPYELGGLMVLEGSHKRDDVLGEYWKMDVDIYCTNGPEASEIEAGKRIWQSDRKDGAFHQDVAVAQQALGGRWLGAEYQVGDLLIFGMHTLHAAADNRTNRIRLSTDSRYQLASEPLDERWVGAEPIGHGPAGKKGMIC